MQNKKLLIALASSPNKKGNSDTALDSFLAGVQEVAPHVIIKKIYLYDLPCASYEYANRLPLPKEKEFSQLCDDLVQASGLVIATPVFNFNVPAKLKNFVDRISFKALDHKKLNILKQPTGQLGHLRTFFVVVGGTPSFVHWLLFPIFPLFWLCVIFLYFGANLGGIMYAGGLNFTHPASKQPAILERAQRRGRRYGRSL